MPEYLAQVSQSVYFFWIALFGAGMLTVSLVFGGLDHDFDHDLDHDHEISGGDGGNMSLLTFKVLWMFIVGFGGGGYFAAEAGAKVLAASLAGILGGVVMGGIGYLLMNFLYKRQGNSLVATAKIIGSSAVVDTTIEPGRIGSVYANFNGSMQFFQAKSESPTTLSVGKEVIVTGVNGITLIVK